MSFGYPSAQNSHNRDRIVVKDCGDVFGGKLVRRVADKEACLTNSTVTDNHASAIARSELVPQPVTIVLEDSQVSASISQRTHFIVGLISGGVTVCLRGLWTVIPFLRAAFTRAFASSFCCLSRLSRRAFSAASVFLLVAGPARLGFGIRSGFEFEFGVDVDFDVAFEFEASRPNGVDGVFPILPETFCKQQRKVIFIHLLWTSPPQ
jgi:hypothetical protein